MISIIISSANAKLLEQVNANITTTVGVPFEIIATDNSAGQQGICAVYNKGAQQAKYDILCFMHEDIIFKTQNWGAVLKNILDKNSQIGLLGVVGGAYKPFTCSSWSGLGLKNVFCNFIQSFKYIQKESYLDYRNPNNVRIERVACLDGVWLATTRKVFAEFKFDEATFKGFHAYDLDLSIAIGQKYEVAVTYDILMDHLSEGRFSPEWIEDTFKLHKKWKDVLPINTRNYTRTECQQMEKVTFKDFVRKLIFLNHPSSVALKALKDKRYKELNIYWKLRWYIFKAYLLEIKGR